MEGESNAGTVIGSESAGFLSWQGWCSLWDFVDNNNVEAFLGCLLFQKFGTTPRQGDGANKRHHLEIGLGIYLKPFSKVENHRRLRSTEILTLQALFL
jgi:hypothetical protein